MTEVAGHHWTAWKQAMLTWSKKHGVDVPPSFDASVDHCGDGCHAFLTSIQRHAGIKLDDGKLGIHTQKLLTPLLPGPTPVERLLAQYHWAVNNQPSIHYAQIRPHPLQKWKSHTTPLTTDCSGAVTCAAFAAGLPDPNGRGYDGQGFTGTLLDHLQHISRAIIRPGDLCVFGGGDGDHVAAVTEVHADPLLFSHGYEGAPIFILFSTEARYHWGDPVTWLRQPYG